MKLIWSSLTIYSHLLSKSQHHLKLRRWVYEPFRSNSKPFELRTQSTCGCVCLDLIRGSYSRREKDPTKRMQITVNRVRQQQYPNNGSSESWTAESASTKFKLFDSSFCSIQIHWSPISDRRFLIVHCRAKFAREGCEVEQTACNRTHWV